MKKVFAVTKVAALLTVFLFFTLLFTTCGGGAAGGAGGASIPADEYTTHNPSGWGGGGSSGGGGGSGGGVNMTGGTPLVVERYEDPVTGTFAGSQLNDLIAAIQNNSSRSNSVFNVPFYVVGDPVVRQARVTKGANKVEKFEHQYKATCNVTSPSGTTNSSVFYYYVNDGINLASVTTSEMTGWQCQEDGSVHSGSHITNITGDVTLVPVYVSGAGPVNAGVIKTDLFTGTIPASDGSPVDYSASYTGGNCYITIPPLPAGTVLYTDNGNDVTVSSYRVNVTIDGNTLSLPFVPSSTESRVIENIPQGASFTATAIIAVSGGNGYTELLTETASSTVQAGGNITLYTKYPYTCGIANAFSQATINGSTTGYYSNNGNPTTINVTPSASYTSGGQTWYFAGWATSPTATNPDIVGNIIPANGTYHGALNLYAVYSSCSVSIASSDSTGTNVIAENSMVSSLTLNAEPAGDFQTTPTYSWNIESPSSNPPVSLSSVSGPSITVTPFTGRTGTATIKVTASDGVHTASSTINVTVAGLSLNITGPIVLAKGGTANIQAEVIGGYSGGIDYSWNPPSNTLFSYSAISGSSNTITANAGGKTTITVGAEITDNGLNLMLSKTIDVYVLDLQLTGSGLTQAGNGYGLMTTMYNTAGTAITASLDGPNMPPTEFTWTLGTGSSTYLDLLGSANDSRNIKPKADGAGTVTVSTSYGGVTVSKTINVVVLGLSLAEDLIYIEKNNNFEITASVPNYGTGVTYDWNFLISSFQEISTTSSPSNNSLSKELKALASGKSTIIVTATIDATGTQLPPKSIDVYVVDMQLLCDSFSPSNSYNIAMTSSATDFSTVTASLAGTGMPSTTFSWAPGTGSSTYLELDGTTGTTCTITPKAAGTGTVIVSTTCGTVTVSKTINVSVAGISLPASPIVLTKGGSAQNITPELTGYSGPVSWGWTDPDSSIATLSDSGGTKTITPVAGGKTTLTVSTNVNGRSLSKTIDIYVLDLQLSGGTDGGLIALGGGNYNLVMPAGSSNVPLTAELANISSSEVTFEWDTISNATIDGMGGSRTITPSSVGQSTFNIRAKITGTNQTVTATVALKVVSLTISCDDIIDYYTNPVKNITISATGGIDLSYLTNIDVTSNNTSRATVAGTATAGTYTLTALQGGTVTITASATVNETSINLAVQKTITILRPQIYQGGSELPNNNITLTYGTPMNINAVLEGELTATSWEWTANPDTPAGNVTFSSVNTASTEITGSAVGKVNVKANATYGGQQYSRTIQIEVQLTSAGLGDCLNSLSNAGNTGDREHPIQLPAIQGLTTDNWTNIQTALQAHQNVYVDLSATQLPNGITNMSGGFGDCTNLVKAPQLPASVEDLSGCFTGCSNLTTPPDLSACTNLEDMSGCFGLCASLTSAVIPASVKDFSNCFYLCIHLHTVTINASVTSAPNPVDFLYYSFEDVSNIDKIKVPDAATREVLYLHGGLSYELRSKVYIPGEAGYDD